MTDASVLAASLGCTARVAESTPCQCDEDSKLKNIIENEAIRQANETRRISAEKSRSSEWSSIEASAKTIIANTEEVSKRADAVTSKVEAEYLVAKNLVSTIGAATYNAQVATQEAKDMATYANESAINADTATAKANAAASAAVTAAATANVAAETAERYGNDANQAAKEAETWTVNAMTATSNANTATENANAATESAKTATDAANTAASTATNAATSAANAAEVAWRAKNNAHDATDSADKAAKAANTAAAAADTATAAAKTAADNANTATTNATTAAETANTAAGKADTATANATAAAEKADTAATNADTATAAAKTATTNANSAAIAADTATANANTAATSATDAATAANTAAALANSAIQAYGARFDGSASAGTRLGAAVGLVANPSTDTVKGENDFDSIYPWAGIRMVNGKMTDNGYVATAVDGQEAFTTAEDTMVQIPLFWYKEEEIDGSTYTWVSPVRQAGWQPNPMCIRKDGTLAEYGYMAAFRLNWSDGTYAGNSTTATPQSVAGAESAWNVSLTDTINAAKRKGANWTCTRIEDIQALRVLFEVEFANRNTQAIMQGNVNQTTVAATIAGEGQFITTNSLANFNVGMWVGLGTAMWNYGTSSRSVKIASIENGVVTFEGFTGSIASGTVMWNAPSPNGACLGVLGASGSPHSNTDGRHPCRYRYVEQPWGDSWEWVSNLLINSIANGVQEPYYLADPSLYTANITDDYERLSYDMPATTGYISHLGIDESKPFVRLTDTMGGGTSTYYGDYYWKADSAGARAVLFGGNANHGSAAGLSYFNVNAAPSPRVVNIRSRLSLAPA